MILINAKLQKIVMRENGGYGLLVILINAKLNINDSSVTNGYGLLVILINAKPFLFVSFSKN